MHDAPETTATFNAYNGWSNRETWLANLWLTDNEDNYEVLESALRQQGEMYEKAEWLEERLHWQLDDVIDEPSLWQDWLCTAFQRVSWIEIIEKNID